MASPQPPEEDDEVEEDVEVEDVDEEDEDVDDDEPQLVSTIVKPAIRLPIIILFARMAFPSPGEP